MLEERVRRLARCFRLVAFAAAAPAGWAACSSSAANPVALDAGVDADPPADAANAMDPEAALDAPTDAGIDSGVPIGSCWGALTITEAGPDAGPDAEELCSYQLACGLTAVNLTNIGCTVVPEDIDGAPVADAAALGFPYCYLLPGQGCDDGGYAPGAGGAVAFQCIGCPGGGGRMSRGMGDVRGRGRTAAGAYFSAMAKLEAASVGAFRELSADLARHGAPEELVRAARASVDDERRHARAISALAKRFGGRRGGEAKRRPAKDEASLFALARENAVEGCVRETYGAMINAVQAERSEDLGVRRALSSVAEDELRHAALAWEIAAWAEGRLSPRERRAVERARRRAAAKVVLEASRGQPAALLAVAGLPEAAYAVRLARGLAESLFLDGPRSRMA